MCTVKDNRPIAYTGSQNLKCFKIKGIFITSIEERSSGNHTVFSQRPLVIGRPSRKDKKDPFSGVINQSYDEIKKRCQEEGCLFEDPEFDAEDSSIFFSRAPPRPFEWKRPHVSFVFCANCTITSCLFFQHECMHSGKAHSQLDFF